MLEEITQLTKDGEVLVGDVMVNVEFFLGGDYKVIITVWLKRMHKLFLFSNSHKLNERN